MISKSENIRVNHKFSIPIKNNDKKTKEIGGGGVEEWEGSHSIGRNVN